MEHLYEDDAELFVAGVKKIQKRTGATQKKIADHLGRPPSTIASWLKLRTRIKPEDQKKIARQFGTNVESVINLGRENIKRTIKGSTLSPPADADLVFTEDDVEKIIEKVVSRTKRQGVTAICRVEDISKMLEEIKAIDKSALRKMYRIVELELGYLKKRS